jgi:hypothetical protein
MGSCSLQGCSTPAIRAPSKSPGVSQRIRRFEPESARRCWSAKARAMPDPRGGSRRDCHRVQRSEAWKQRVTPRRSLPPADYALWPDAAAGQSTAPLGLCRWTLAPGGEYVEYVRQVGRVLTFARRHGFDDERQPGRHGATTSCSSRAGPCGGPRRRRWRRARQAGGPSRPRSRCWRPLRAPRCRSVR